MRNLPGLRFVIACLVLLGGCRHEQKQHPSDSAARPRTVVLWISIDGVRPDYLDRAPTPLIHKLMREGIYSTQVTTITPTLTFPSHVSEATGVPVSQHGIVANDYYDLATHRLEKFPKIAAMLEAEPIWLTAQRQGLRTLVFDWPLSQNQTAAVHSDYFLKTFQTMPDSQRLQRLLDTWRSDAGEKPLRLLMGYMVGTDSTGHKYGPDSPQIVAKIEEVDTALANLVEQAIAIFRQKMSADDQLYVLLTTDHGMMRVRTLVNFHRLFASTQPQGTQLVTSGPLGMIYFDGEARPQARQLTTSMLAELRRYDFLWAYPRNGVPGEWQFAHPSRVGDIVVMLKPGYTFSTRPTEATVPVETIGDPLGMHGYPADHNPDMLGFCVLWRYPTPLGGKDLGRVHVFQFHPTVAALLGVKPAPGANGSALAH